MRDRLRRLIIADIDAAVGDALLRALRRQAVRISVPVTLMALIVVWLGAGRVPVAAQIVWLIAVAVLQAVRFMRLSQLVQRVSMPLEDRLFEAFGWSIVNGALIGASALFFPYLDEVGRCVQTMIMVGMVTGAVASNHGYRPLFFAFLVPVLLPYALAWVLVPSLSLSIEFRLSIAALIGLLGYTFTGLARESYASFVQGFQINAELKRALASEQSANNAKTRFLAAASHDLRQPLQTLSMFSGALGLRPLDAKSSEIAENIKMATSDLTTELDALLDISKLDAGVIEVAHEPINLSQFVQRIVELNRPVAEQKGLTLNVEILTTPWVESDRVLLERVLRNLLENALKYTNHGTVTVTVASAPKGCEISVADTGIGIEPSEQARIFEEFYQLGNTARDRRKGLGLGLSIVSRLVPMLGAELTMHSVPGRGSTFALQLPCVEPVQAPTIAASTEAIHLGGLKILLIEDDAGVRVGTKLLLEGYGCDVIDVTDGTQALAANDANAFDVVLADIRLPGALDGITVARRLREHRSDLPIILISGETSPERLREAGKLQAPLLVKPIGERMLVEAVFDVTKHRQRV